MKKTRILFVCTGNVFRSMTAENCLRKYAQDKNIDFLEADSAGICVGLDTFIPPFISNCLVSLDIDTSAHKQKQIEEKHIRESDLVVAMGKNHRRFIKDNFGYSSRLFNEVCYGKEISVFDICEMIPNWRENMDTSAKYAKWVINRIYDSMPLFVENYERFIVTSQ